MATVTRSRSKNRKPARRSSAAASSTPTKLYQPWLHNTETGTTEPGDIPCSREEADHFAATFNAAMKSKPWRAIVRPVALAARDRQSDRRIVGRTLRGYSQVVEIRDGKERIIVPCALTAHAESAAANYNATASRSRAVVRRLALPSTLKTKGGAR